MPNVPINDITNLPVMAFITAASIIVPAANGAVCQRRNDI